MFGSMATRVLIATLSLAFGASAQSVPDLTGDWQISGVLQCSGPQIDFANCVLDKSQSATLHIVDNGDSLSGQFVAPLGTYFPNAAPSPGGSSGPFTAPVTGMVGAALNLGLQHCGGQV